jgi:hypothetical protein
MALAVPREISCFWQIGDFVYRHETYRDMQAVQTGNDLSPAVRRAGYGKPLSIGKSKNGTLYRFVNRCWYRLTEGGPPLGPSPFFALASASDPSLARTRQKPLILSAGECALGADENLQLVTLLANGTIRVFDLTFEPGSKIDVCSPRLELARKQGSSKLAIRVPELGAAYLIDHPHPLAPPIQWLEFASGHWYPRQAFSSGPHARGSRSRRLISQLLSVVAVQSHSTLRQRPAGNMRSANFNQPFHDLKECITTRPGLKDLFLCFRLLRSA